MSTVNLTTILVSMLFLVAKTRPVQIDSNSTCLDCIGLIGSFFTDQNAGTIFTKFDFVLEFHTRPEILKLCQDNIAQFIQRSKVNVNSIAIASTTQNGLSPRILGLNERSENPSLWIYPCIQNLQDLSRILENIAHFYNRHQNGQKWTPIFVLIYSPMIPESQNWPTEAVHNFSVSSDVYILSRTRTNSIWILQEIYSIRTQVFRNHFQLSSIEAFEGLLQDVILNKTVRRSNFNGATVIAIGDDDVNYALATKFKDGSLELESGFEVEIYRYFRDALNFSEVAIKAVGYISEGPNGTLLGSAMQLKHGDGDLAIGAMEFLEYRLRGPDGVTYLHPTFYANVYAYFKQPPSSSVRNIYTQAFTTELWAASTFLWMIIIVALKFLGYARRSRVHADPGSDSRDEVVDEEAFIWAAGAICQQGWHSSPFSTPIRAIFFGGLFFGYILFVAFAAALVSILSVEVVPIQAFLDLLEYKFYMVSDAHIPTSREVVQGLEDSRQIPKLPVGTRNVEISENLAKLFASDYAIITIADAFYPILQQRGFAESSICETISRQAVSSRPLKSSCVIRRGSALREFLNFKMGVMYERGVRERIVQNYVRDTSVHCLKSSGGFHTQLGPNDIFTAYIIYLAGVLLSVVILFLERSFK